MVASERQNHPRLPVTLQPATDSIIALSKSAQNVSSSTDL